MLDPISIIHTGVPQGPNKKIIPAKQVMPLEKTSWNIITFGFSNVVLFLPAVKILERIYGENKPQEIIGLALPQITAIMIHCYNSTNGNCVDLKNDKRNSLKELVNYLKFSAKKKNPKQLSLNQSSKIGMIFLGLRHQKF